MGEKTTKSKYIDSVFLLNLDEFKQVIDDSKNFEKRKEYTYKDGTPVPADALVVRIKATHSGYVIFNDVEYTDNLLKNSYKTFIEPTEKPIIIGHTTDADEVIGRIIDARFVPISGAKEGEPTGYIELVAAITDYSSIIKIKDKRYLTVSIRMYPTEKTTWTCSICGEKMKTYDDYFEHMDIHARGQIYEGKKCYYVMDGYGNYAHVAVVTEPADEYAEIVINDSKNHEVMMDGKNYKKATDDSKDPKNEEDTKVSGSEENHDDNSKVKTPQDGDESAKNNDTSDKTEDVAENDNAKDDNKEPESENSTDENTEDKTDASENKEDDSENTDDDVEYDFSDITDDEKMELETITDIIYNAVSNDAKLSAKQRKALKDSDFCGPNRSFPVPDCSHVSAGLRLLSKAKVSENTKKKIKSCINKKAKKMKCSSAKDSYSPLEQMLMNKELQDYLQDNYYKKDEIDNIVETLTKTVIANISDALHNEKYQILSNDFNTLITQFSDLKKENKKLKVDTLKIIKALSSDDSVNASEIIVTDDEVANITTIINDHLKELSGIPGNEDANKESQDDSKNKDNKEDNSKSTKENKPLSIDYVYDEIEDDGFSTVY